MIRQAIQAGIVKIRNFDKVMEKNATQIDPESTIGERKNEFECAICLQIVENPAQCYQCDTVFCGTCINVVLDNSCPNCEVNLLAKPAKRLDRILQKYLNQMKFSCKSCKEAYLYPEKMDHHFKCQAKALLECPLKCATD
jgi:hypothetical protein